MMPIEFKVRTSDLKNATKQLLVTRGQAVKEDFVDVLVSECIATFRTVGTSTELPVQGVQTGTARLPLLILERFAAVAKTFKANETRILIVEGLIRIGGWQTENIEITLGIIPNQRLDLPADASFLDTLALASLLTADAIREQGLQKRIAEAQRVREEAIDRATRAMEPLQVGRQQIATFIEEHVVRAGERLRDAFG